MEKNQDNPRRIIDCEQVIREEFKQLRKRRKQLSKVCGHPDEPFDETRFGIALSGGGIRSATINLGIIRTLNECGVLEKADYLSTVSGGGYTGSYVQATLRDRKAYNKLFDEADIEHLRSYGDYLIPGQSSRMKFWNTFLLVTGYLGSLLMSLVSPAIVVMILLIIRRLLLMLSGDTDLEAMDNLISFSKAEQGFGYYLGIGLLSLLGVHFVVKLFYKYSLDISRRFTQMQAILTALLLGLYLAHLLVRLIAPVEELNFTVAGMNVDLSNNGVLFLFLVILIGLGFVLNPNALSFHRYYRGQLAKAFLERSGSFKNIRLADMFNPDGKQEDWVAPYPLINTCLNLQDPKGDDKFKGAKASDYFLLSPLFSGSKLSGYVSTQTYPGFNQMTLPAATTISAAAVNPGMGVYSNKMLSVIMTLFNARLGFWVNNPLKPKSPYIVWWPFYFFYELFTKIGTSNHMLNISDGGHIENLATYELLRRDCRLIIAVDAGEDPEYMFEDLENLTVRARNELGIDIDFREGQDPEVIIRPKPSRGYSDKRFAIADLYRIWDEFPIPLDGHDDEFELDDRGREVEVLVNYCPEGEWAPRVSIKGHLSDERRNALWEKGCAMVEAQLASIPGEDGRHKVKVGTLVYVKSSVTAPTMKPYIRPGKPGEPIAEKYDTYKYKIYHPAFPHEPTSDQFFDPVQWESYYQLGQFLGAEILGISNRQFNRMRTGREMTPNFSREELIRFFDGLPPFLREETEPETGAEEITREVFQPQVEPVVGPAPAPSAPTEQASPRVMHAQEDDSGYNM
jgi:hypothetical protein